MQIRHFGGAFADDREGRGSHGPVTEPYNLFALGVPAVPELVAPIEMFFGRLGAAVAHVASGRTLLNFLEFDEDPGQWWTPATRERLAARQAGLRPAAHHPQQPPRPRLSGHRRKEQSDERRGQPRRRGRWPARQP